MNPSPIHGARVFLIDDVPANLGVLGEVFTQAGAKVFVAQSGASALARLSTVQPDLILLDVSMPGMDGFAVCRHLKTESAWRDTPVIFITALNEVSDRLTGFIAGGVDYIVKPFQTEEVLARASTHLRLRTLQRELAAQAAAVQAKNEELEREIQRRLATELAIRRSLDRAVLVAARNGTIRFCSDRAALLLKSFFPHCAPGCVPAILLAGHATPGLRVQRSSRDDTDEIVWMLEAAPPPATPQRLEPLGLTPREAEILFWVAHGKTNSEIGIILGMAENTVKKHVYNILPKVGVETRIAAALLATETLGLVPG
ncbi:response regulator [Oleiharenicola lentus]|uniref:response regulator n=1 Tax=Oleiharenicola lentus TaxID=2508720 RepID=UPI003F66CEF8